MYILSHKIYLEEKVNIILVFVWTGWPVHTIGSTGQPIEPDDWQ
jgi:hypothetical protein